MRIVVTGSSGHLGEALVRVLKGDSHTVVGVDLNESPYTDIVGSVVDPACAREALRGADIVLHTATLHKPHIVTHSKQQFVDTNVTGTLTLLEEAVRVGVSAFVYTSSTSVFGDALRPPAGTPAAWITEEVEPIPKNIYGITKLAAEQLCRLFNRRHGLNAVVLRTSRFFLDEDDDGSKRSEYADGNLKANEFLFRRVDLEDVVGAHIQAYEKAASIGFDRFIVSATTPFKESDLENLRRDPSASVRKYLPRFEAVYAKLGWRMFSDVERVYVNAKARNALDWAPQWDFSRVLDCLDSGRDPRSALATAVGFKGYHVGEFEGGVYPVE